MEPADERPRARVQRGWISRVSALGTLSRDVGSVRPEPRRTSAARVRRSIVGAMSAPELIRIVSRDSPMALAQVARVRAQLAAHHPATVTEVVPVRTTGDKWMGDLSQVEGKGAFTKEVDAALLAGEADLAVHCVKDIPADRPLPALHDVRRVPRARRHPRRPGPPGRAHARPAARRSARRHLVGPQGRATRRLAPPSELRPVPRERQPTAREARRGGGGRAPPGRRGPPPHRPPRRDQRGPRPGDDVPADRRGRPRPAVP